MPSLKTSAFEASKLVSTKTLLPLGTKLLHTVSLFWGIIFGNY